jgi:hypothetical protein
LDTPQNRERARALLMSLWGNGGDDTLTNPFILGKLIDGFNIVISHSDSLTLLVIPEQVIIKSGQCKFKLTYLTI